MKKILYVGNKLKGSVQSVTTIDTLTSLLTEETYDVFTTSDKKNKLLRLLDMVFTFLKLHKKIDFMLLDTYSTSNFMYAYVLSVLSKLFKVKYIPILHGGNLPDRLLNSPKMSNQIFKNSFKNIAPSNYLKFAFEKYGYPVDYIPNVLEIKNYNFKKRIVIQPNLIWVRSFAHIYNPTMAIKVLEQLKKTYPEAKLCMVGAVKDDSYNDCKDLIQKFNLEDSIELTGLLTQQEWNKKADEFDIFINTTNFDNTPVSVMEAMALGLPIVSTDVGGLPYLIEDRIDGVLVPKNDIEQMKNVIYDLLENIINVEEITNNAREKVIQFDWQIVKKQWNNIFTDV